MNKIGPFTRTQQLRRQMNRNINESRKRTPFELNKSVSLSSDSSFSNASESCSSRGSDDDFHKPKKRLSFSKYASVILVPCINEYKEAGLFDSLWHEKAEMDVFKNSARQEVFDFMQRESCWDFKEAIRSLYHAKPNPANPCSGEQSSVPEGSNTEFQHV